MPKARQIIERWASSRTRSRAASSARRIGRRGRSRPRTCRPGIGPRRGRSFGTAIYYLLTAETFSEMHRLPTEEVFHLYLGGPVRMLQLFPDGGGREVVIGGDILAGQQPQVIVPPGVWQGSRLEPGVDFVLLGATMAPGLRLHRLRAGQEGRIGRAVPAIRRNDRGTDESAVTNPMAAAEQGKSGGRHQLVTTPGPFGGSDLWHHGGPARQILT